MERKKYIFIILISVLTLGSFAQSNPLIYQAYIRGDMARWKIITDSIEKTARTNPEKLELVNCQYGYIAWCIDRVKKKEATTYLKKAQELVRQLEEKKYKPDMINAYKAAFIGFEIGISTYKAPFIGPQSISYAKNSVSMDAQNAFGYTQLGNIAFYTPKTFGGNKTEAMQYYLKALRIMERNPENIKHNWNYLNLLVTIIEAYIELDNYDTAAKYCIKTLKAEPDFDWVKNQLYPQVKKKIKP